MNEIISKIITIEKEIEIQSELISPRDYKFYHIPRLLQTAKLMQKHAADCNECKHFLNEIETFAPEIANLINGSFTNKNKFEKQSEFWFKHLTKKHEYSIKGYQSSLIIFYSLVASTVVGVLAALLINLSIIKFTVLVSWALGLIVGSLLASKKEKKLLAEGKLI